MLFVENRHREGRIFLMNINETTSTCVHNAHGILTVTKISSYEVFVKRQEVSSLRICLLLFAW